MEVQEKFNHNRPLSDFEESINVLRKHGFNPIAASQLFMEDTFVFESKEEATKAYNLLEIEKKVLKGWFYSKSAFEKEVVSYEDDFECKVLVYNLK